MVYLTPEHYEIAAKNGISRTLVSKRVYERSWLPERAVTEPKHIVTGNPISDEIRDTLKKNGITTTLYRSRIVKGWSEERASTQPVGTNTRKLLYSKELVATAASHGISYNLLASRVRKGWSLGEASTREPMSKIEASRLGAAGRKLAQRRGSY